MRLWDLFCLQYSQAWTQRQPEQQNSENQVQEQIAPRGALYFCSEEWEGAPCLSGTTGETPLLFLLVFPCKPPGIPAEGVLVKENIYKS